MTHWGNLFFHFYNFRLYGSRVPISSEEMLPTGNLLRVSLQLQLELWSGHFGLPMSIDKAAQSRATAFEEVVDPDRHEAIRLLLCHGSRGQISDIFRALPCQVLAVNGKYSNACLIRG